MIEYMEILEDGYDRSKSFAIKAFLRRSLAYYNKGDFIKSYEDANKSQEIGGEDKEIIEHL